MAAAARLALDEAKARQVLLAQAVEAADEQGALVSEVERDHVERLAAQAGAAQGASPDPATYLPARAKELLRIVEQRHPSLLRLELRDPWWDRLAVLLPVVALVAGFGSDRIGDPRDLDLLSLPLLGFVAWNLVVYGLLLVSAFAPKSAARSRPVDRALGWLAAVPTWFTERATARLRRSVTAQFRSLWWRAAGALEAARIQRVLHVSAAAWALGLVASLAWNGLAHQYRVSWDSTWLGAPQVQGLANGVSLPGRALMGIEPFSRADIEQLHVDSKSPSTQQQARQWALLYIACLLAVVAVPRVLLALWTGWRIRRLARSVRLDLGDPYFAEAVGRVSPVRLVVQLRAADPALKGSLACVVRQAGGDGASAGTLLRTARDDELVVIEAGEADADQVWQAGASAQEPPWLEIEGAGSRTRLDWATCAACWPLEARIRDAIVRHTPPWKRMGVARLMDEWARQHERRWSAAVNVLAASLAQSARDSEPVASGWSSGKAREAAQSKLLERLHERLAGTHRALLALHAADGLLLPAHLQRDDGALAAWLTPVNAGAAGTVAGLAAGALAGAKIDLLTGGLTAGAGAAVGALIGGASALGAARRAELGGSVRPSHEQLQSVVELVLLQYLAVIHAGRSADAAAPVRADWQSEVVAAVAALGDEWQAAWKPVQQAESEEAASALLAPLVRQSAATVLRRLYPGQALAPLEAGPAVSA